MAKKNVKQSNNVQIKNRKAYHDYEFVEKVEAGISLKGTEVKALRERQADLEGAYGRIDNGEVWLIGCTISAYSQASTGNHDPNRKRKLLLHGRQIVKLESRVHQKGFTLIPTRIYFNDRGLAKVELAVGRGKRQYDKRSKITEAQQKRDLRKQLKKYM